MRNLSYEWKIKNDYPPPCKPPIKVFGTFVCGGGSTMGYKLAGCEHLGGVEIDKEMARIYIENHQPKYFYLEDIRTFNNRNDLPDELYNLDILDGSPPCTSFSMAGNREKDWGKEKHFREGQKKQRLDDLVFVYCETILKLRPKVAILENVPGIIAGMAKSYAIGIYDILSSNGYQVQIFRLNSATMGVPQSRERIFFIARRKDLKLSDLKLSFNEMPVQFGNIVELNAAIKKPLQPSIAARWLFVEKGDECLKYADMKYRGLDKPKSFFSTSIYYNDSVPMTLTSGGNCLYYEESRHLSDLELIKMSSFPIDYDFAGLDVRYVCGMSVPPLMTARITSQIIDQWF